MDVLISILLGMLPEVLYFTLFLIYTKNIKDKKVKLFVLISIAYVLCIMISQYKILYYFCFMFLIYIILKILYKSKSQITDIFIAFLAYGYICVLSLLIYIPKNEIQYYICLIINRFLLFLPFLFKSKFYIVYKKYCSLWNRNYKVKQPIKSITLRTVSLLFINFIIFSFNIIMSYIIELVNK